MGAPFREPKPRAVFEISLRRSRRPIGVGKTSLAKRLSGRLHSTLVSSIRSRIRFCRASTRTCPASPCRPSCFSFSSGSAVAGARADGPLHPAHRLRFSSGKGPAVRAPDALADELHLYQQIFDALSPQAPRPDLVIYLQADPGTLHERVRRRGVEFERPITGEYLALLADSYNRFFYHFTGAPS